MANHHDQLICASHSHTHYWYEVGMRVENAGDIHEQRVGGWGVMCCQTFSFYDVFPDQQTTSGIGHPVKDVFELATNMLNVIDNFNNKP